ncbi:hypothetical protein GOBAR_AA09267 [Gossypium barbadense]|uniref:NAD(P)-binding domain-containing protein n=1 Tax=Gossypium barbadense TaxID=3634 RepID=A0A2P5Y6Z6_GOSBA|nr:hypothetical protein GOBAR_AA09267 [Gossypium barbadense]
MERCSLQSPAITTVPSSLSRSGFIEKPLGYGRILKLPTCKKYPHGRKLKFFDFRAQASELLKLGFRVRAGVRSAQKAETLVQKQDTIAPAIGNASVVICCIGASEKEIFDITGPYRIDYQATKNLIDAATAVKVNHFILVSSLGTNKVGFPAAILNLFWGVLIWKRKAEEALIASGLPYTIVRPGGMERPTDAFKETHNITLSTEDTLFGGLVAELMACMAKNRSRSYCKVVEVVAETTAPLRPMEELLAKIPSQRADISSPKPNEIGFSVELSRSLFIPPGMYLLPYDHYHTFLLLETTKISSETAGTISNKADSKDEDLAFVAGATGRVGSRTVEYDTPTKPDPAPARSIVTEKPTTPTEKEPAQAKVLKTEPLSPYTVQELIDFDSYDDLKPPSSPSPTPGRPKEVSSSASAPAENVSTSTEGNSVPAAVATDITEKDSSKHSTSRSPYYAYADLKPPTSPYPRAPTNAPADSGSKGDTLSGNSTAQSPIAEKPGDEQPDTKPTPRPLSPFAMYADLKPPSTPSPRAPTSAPVDSGSEGATLSGNSTAQSSIADKPSDEQHNTKPTPRPLSPFAMYEDLKPPTSPIPSPKKS